MTAPMVAAAAPTVIERAPQVQKRGHKWPLVAIIFGPLIALGLAFLAILHRDREQQKVAAPVAIPAPTGSAKPSTSTMAVTAAPATVATVETVEKKTETSAGEAAGAPLRTAPTPPPQTQTQPPPAPPTQVTPTAEQLYTQGLDAMVNRQPQEARRLFSEAIAADPHNAKAHFRLGEIALLNRNFDHSNDQFNRALANAENLEPREHSLCDLGLAIGRDDRLEANRLAREIRDQYPSDPDLAAIHRQFGAFFGKIDEEQPRKFPRRRRFQ